MASRDQLIQNIFENMQSMKRGMHTYMQQLGEVFRLLSPAQMELLFTIQHLAPISSKQLASHMRLSPGAISQLVDVVTEAGYVSRRADPNDRRIQYLQLSDSGQELLKTIERQRRQMLEQATRSLTDNELALWLKVQQKMINEFNSATNKRSTHEII